MYSNPELIQEIDQNYYLDQIWLEGLLETLGAEEQRMVLEVIDDQKNLKEIPQWQVKRLQELIADYMDRPEVYELLD